MGQPHCGVRRIDALSAVSGGAVYIDANIVWIDFYFYIIHLRQYGNRCRRCVDAAGAFGFRYALHAMRAGFIFESGISPFPFDQNTGFLDTADTGIIGIHNLCLPAAALRVAQIHTQKILREQRGLFAAGTRAHLQNDIFVIVRIFWKQEDLELFLQLRKLLLVFGDLHLGEFAQLLIAGIQHFLSLRDRLLRLFVFPVFSDDRLHFAHLFDVFLPELLIVDDIRVRNFQRQFFVFFQYEIEFIKHWVLLHFILF